MILHGNCLDKLKELEDNSVDSIITDPPYELGFMGKSWDNTGIANNVEMWKECLRVLKPGGHLLSFGGTRTYHRMASAIEDAGFEVRDMIEWVYGSGFPKSLNIGKAVDKSDKGSAKLDFVRWMQTTGIRAKDIDDRLKTKGLISQTSNFAVHFFNEGQPALPTKEYWEVIQAICDELKITPPNEIEEYIDLRVYGSKQFRQREVVGKKDGNLLAVAPGQDNNRSATTLDITAPATEAAKQWEGWGTALKPAHEPICLARKPIECKTVAENVLKYGTGGINIDESRVDYQSEADKASATPQGKCTSNTSAGSAPDVDMSEVDYNGERYWYKNEYKWLVDKWLNDEDYVWSELKENLETYDWCKVPEIDSGDRVLFDSGEGVCIRLYESKRKEFVRPEQLGRFPANLIHDNSEEVRECFPETKTGKAVRSNSGGKTFGGENTKPVMEDLGYDDNGGNASRFFKSIIYQAKASKSERNNGLEDFETKQSVGGGGGIGDYLNDVNSASGKFGSEKAPAKNNHPTVKPIALMEYLIKMVTPKGGIVLDPFAGSGSTLVAAKQNGYKYIGIEMDAEYIKIAEARLK